MNEQRLDRRDEPWAARPWVMAALCAVAGLVFQALADVEGTGEPAVWRQALATAVAVSTLAFALTVERRRLGWAVGFALGWGGVIGLVGWSTGHYGADPTIFEWPFFSGVFAVLVAAPLFQAARDEGAWRFPPPLVFGHVWADAVIGAAALAFVGVTFLLALLIAGLFDLIGIDLLKQLLDEGWFGWSLAGFAFGAGVGILRERDALVATMQRLVLVILSVLAPVLAAALLLFLLSLPIAGLTGLWDGWLSATALMLAAAAGSAVLINAAIGPGEDGAPAGPRILHWSALTLALAVLPLASLAAVALGLRIGQYGWTPERMWGAIAVALALAYGLNGWWAVLRGRLAFEPPFRIGQVRLSLGACALALILALPIIDFGAIAARDQLHRLRSGAVTAAQFDWMAMAYDFGPAGRNALVRLARSGSPTQRRLAAAALASEGRYAVGNDIDAATTAGLLDDRLRIDPAGRALPPALRTHLLETRLCSVGPCILRWLGPDRAVLIGRRGVGSDVEGLAVVRGEGDAWEERALVALPQPSPAPTPPVSDLSTARVELRPVERQLLVVDGRILGELTE